MSGNPCLILEWSDAEEWLPLFGSEKDKFLGTVPVRIPAGRSPAVVQPNRTVAEAEAKRLAAAHPGKRFAIFEALLVGMTADVPSHVTVSGDVWLTRRVPVLVDIDDSQVPF